MSFLRWSGLGCAFAVIGCNRSPDSTPAVATATIPSASSSASATAASGAPLDSAAPASSAPTSMTMRPHETGPFIRGPELVPTARLRMWLDAQTKDGKPRLVKLPITMGADKRGARIGDALDALIVDLDDGMLGVALDDHRQQRCAHVPRCSFLLEGYWVIGDGGPHRFRIVRVAGFLDAPNAARVAFAEVERSP